MRYTAPHYYGKFKCTANKCEDTCCAGWQIVIDERTLNRYKKVKGPFGNRLRNSIDWKEGVFHQYDGRCAFLDEDGLCDICSEFGPKMFCKTCRNYPRHIEEFPDVREITLSLSCMEAAKLILGCKEPVRFLTKENEKEEPEYEDFDFFLYDKLLAVRECAIRILQNREISIGIRVSMALALAHDTECKLQKQRLFEIDELCARYEKESAKAWFEKELKVYKRDGKERCDYMKRMFGIFEKLEVLRKDWPDYVRDIKETLFEKGKETYGEQRKRFQEEVLYQNCYTEQLMVYFVSTYFCGGVYDGYAFSKMQMAAVSTLLIEELSFGIWKRQGGKLSFHDLVDAAHRFSREIEHSDDNLEKLETIVRKEKMFNLKKLLTAIG